MLWILCALAVPAIMGMAIAMVWRAIDRVDLGHGSTLSCPAPVVVDTDEVNYYEGYEWEPENYLHGVTLNGYAVEEYEATALWWDAEQENAVPEEEDDPFEDMVSTAPMRPRCNRLDKTDQHRMRDGHPLGRCLHLTESEKWELVRAEATRVERDDVVWWNITKPLLEAELGLR